MGRFSLTGLTIEADMELEAWDQATSTYDVCWACENQLFQGMPLHTLNQDLRHPIRPYNGEPKVTFAIDLGNAHPPYQECDYSCVICGVRLVEADN